MPQELPLYSTAREPLVITTRGLESELAGPLSDSLLAALRLMSFDHTARGPVLGYGWLTTSYFWRKENRFFTQSGLVPRLLERARSLKLDVELETIGRWPKHEKWAWRLADDDGNEGAVPDVLFAVRTHPNGIVWLNDPEIWRLTLAELAAASWNTRTLIVAPSRSLDTLEDAVMKRARHVLARPGGHQIVRLGSVSELMKRKKEYWDRVIFTDADSIFSPEPIEWWRTRLGRTQTYAVLLDEEPVPPSSSLHGRELRLQLDLECLVGPLIYPVTPALDSTSAGNVVTFCDPLFKEASPHAKKSGKMPTSAMSVKDRNEFVARFVNRLSQESQQLPVPIPGNPRIAVLVDSTPQAIQLGQLLPGWRMSNRRAKEGPIRSVEHESILTHSLLTKDAKTTAMPLNVDVLVRVSSSADMGVLPESFDQSLNPRYKPVIIDIPFQDDEQDSRLLGRMHNDLDSGWCVLDGQERYQIFSGSRRLVTPRKVQDEASRLAKHASTS